MSDTAFRMQNPLPVAGGDGWRVIGCHTPRYRNQAANPDEARRLIGSGFQPTVAARRAETLSLITWQHRRLLLKQQPDLRLHQVPVIRMLMAIRNRR